MTNRISTGSTVPGIHPIPTPNGSTRRRHGKHLKSTWTTGASWFSNTPRKEHGRPACFPNPKNRRQNEFLAKRPGKLRSRQMKTAENPPNSAKHRRPAEHSSFQRFSFQHFSFTQIPLFPRNPLFPASGPANRSFNGLHLKSKFLALRGHGSDFSSREILGTAGHGKRVERATRRTPDKTQYPEQWRPSPD